MSKTPVYLTTKEAADIARCNKKVILREIKAGNIKAVLFGRKYLIEENDFIEYMKKQNGKE